MFDLISLCIHTTHLDRWQEWAGPRNMDYHENVARSSGGRIWFGMVNGFVEHYIRIGGQYGHCVGREKGSKQNDLKRTQKFCSGRRMGSTKQIYGYTVIGSVMDTCWSWLFAEHRIWFMERNISISFLIVRSDCIQLIRWKFSVASTNRLIQWTNRHHIIAKRFVFFTMTHCKHFIDAFAFRPMDYWCKFIISM